MEEGLAQSTGGVCGHADQRVGLGVDVVAERVSGAGAAWQDLDLDVEVVDRRDCPGKLLFVLARWVSKTQGEPEFLWQRESGASAE